MRSLVLCLSASLLFSLPSQGQVQSCAVAVQDTTSARVEKSLQMLKGLFNGSSTNAGIAVDRILNEVQLRLTELDSKKIMDSYANESGLAQKHTDQLQKALESLEKSLETKSSGFFKRFREASVRKQVEERISELEAGRKETAGVIESTQKNIESLRQQQLDLESWQLSIQLEIDYLQGLVDRLMLETQEIGVSANLVHNFNEEILPRLMNQTNNLMSQQLSMAKMLSAGLKNKVAVEQMALENLQTLQNMSRDMALMSAKNFLGQELVRSVEDEKQQHENEMACLNKQFCAGEEVAYWPHGIGVRHGENPTLVNGTLNNVVHGDRSQIILSANNGLQTFHNSHLARSQKGLSRKGFVIDSLVLQKNASVYWKVNGIFSNGDLLLKKVYTPYIDKKTKLITANPDFYSANGEYFYYYIRLPAELVEKYQIEPRGSR